MALSSAESNGSMFFNITAIVLGVTALVVYAVGVRSNRPHALRLMAFLALGALLAATVVVVPRAPIQRRFRQWRLSRQQERARHEYLRELGGLIGRELAHDLPADAAFLVIGGPEGYLDEEEASVMKKALEERTGLRIDITAAAAPECRDAQCYNLIIEPLAGTGIDVIISTLPLKNRRELIYELEELSCFGWDDPPLFAAVAGFYYNPPMLRQYLRDGLLKTVVLYPAEDEGQAAFGPDNMDDLPAVSPGEKPRYRYIANMAAMFARTLAPGLSPDAKILKIGGPAEGYLDQRETGAMEAAFEEAAGFSVEIIAVNAPEIDDVPSFNAIIEPYEDRDIELIISALPVSDRRDFIYGLEDLSSFDWDEAPIFAAVAGSYYNPDMLRTYLRDGLLGAVSLYRSGEEGMIVVDGAGIDAIPDVSPREALRYSFIERLGRVLGRKTGPGLDRGARVLIVGGPPPKRYMDQREIAAWKEAFEAEAGFSIEVLAIDDPADYNNAQSLNAMLGPYEGRDIDLVVSLAARSGLPAESDELMQLVRYELEDLSIFKWDNVPMFAAWAGTSYDPEALRQYIRRGLLHTVVLYPPERGRKIAINADNIEDLPDAAAAGPFSRDSF